MTTFEAFRWAWRVLLLVGVGLELWAIRNSTSGDTLSERVVYIEHLPFIGRILRCLLAAFMVWLIVHFIFASEKDGLAIFKWRGRELALCLVAGLCAWVLWTAYLMIMVGPVTAEIKNGPAAATEQPKATAPRKP